MLHLVETIMTGDPEFAGSAMRGHLANVARAIEAQMTELEDRSEGFTPYGAHPTEHSQGSVLESTGRTRHATRARLPSSDGAG